MQTGRWLNLRTENVEKSVGSANDSYESGVVSENDVMDFRFSSSGRYGYLVREHAVAAPSDSEQVTHYYEHFFTVIDTFRGTLTQYKTDNFVFKTYHRFYVLNDDMCVLVDFSRFYSIVTQHLLHFDHNNGIVRCKLSRRWSFGVDEMLAGTDGTYVPGTSQLLHIGNEKFLPLLGQIDRLNGQVVMRIVPADPRNASPVACRHASRLFLFNPNALTCSPSTRVHTSTGVEIHAPTKRRDAQQAVEARRLSGCTTDYPFIFESKLYFFVSRTINDPTFQHPATAVNGMNEPLSFCIRWLLDVDVGALLTSASPFSNTASGIGTPSSSLGSSVRRHVASTVTALRRIQLQNVGSPSTLPRAAPNAANGNGSGTVGSGLFATLATTIVDAAEYRRASLGAGESPADISLNGVRASPAVELIQRGTSFINLRLVDTSRSDLDADRDVIEMYTYIQAGPKIYVRVQYRSPIHRNFNAIQSKWICLDLKTYQWTTFFRQPCRARIPFWFCGIPDGRAFFYRQLWKRGTKEVIVRQLRVMLPPRDVMPLRHLAFLNYGCAKHLALEMDAVRVEFGRQLSTVGDNQGGDNNSGSLAPNLKSSKSVTSKNGDVKEHGCIDANVVGETKQRDEMCRHKCREEVDAHISQLQRVFQLFESF